jgi:hypothetical protein
MPNPGGEVAEADPVPKKREAVAPPAKRVARNVTEHQFRGRLRPIEANTRPSFEDYTVALAINRRTVTLNAEGEEESVAVETRRNTASAAKNGEFVVEPFLDNDVVAELRVFGPAGKEVVVESQVEDDGIRVVKVRPATAITASGVAEPTTRSVLLRGFVVERTTMHPAPSGVTVSIWRARRPGGTSPIGTAVTNKGGLFELVLTVEGGDQLEARLGTDTKNSTRVPTPQPGEQSVTAILPLYTAPETPEGDTAPESDCSCQDGATARLPDATTLATDPTYSADLGGRCVQFTVPNRALEEFDLYSIVRTTDPALQPITLSDDSQPSLVDNNGRSARPVYAMRAATAALEEVPAVDVTAPASAGGQAAEAMPVTVFRLAAPEPTGVPVEAPRVEARTYEASAPEVIAPTSNALAVIEAFRHGKAALLPEHMNEVNARPFRTPISEATPIDWDDSPTINQAVSIAHGHLLHWRQTWRADGYSLGELLYSLPLAAGQKRRVAILDWERTDLASRGEETFFDEALSNMATHERDLTEVVNGAIREGISGGSRSTSLGFGTGTGGAASGTVEMVNLGAVFGISGGAGYADASSFQRAARKASADSAQTLRELTMQSASATRGVRSTTVVAIGEEETARATTEVIANHNHCHAVTVQYFEVLRHLRVDTKLADVQECLFVPLTMRPFDPDKVLRWRKELAPAVHQPEFSGAFDAIQRVAAHWQLSGEPLGRYADEHVEAIRGELRIMISVPIPPPPPDLTLQKMAIENAAAIGTAALEAANSALNATPDWMKGVHTFLTLGGSDSARAGAVAGNNAAIDSIRRQAEYQMAMLDRLPSERGRHDFFFTYLMPRFVAAFIDQLTLIVTDDTGKKHKIEGVDFTLVDNYVPGSPLRVTFNAPDISGVTRASIRSMTVRSELPLPSGCRAVAYGINADYSTAGFEHRLVMQPRVVDDIDCGEFAYSNTNVEIVNLAKQLAGPGLTVRCPLDAWEQRKPRLEDVRLAAALLDHLNDHLEHFHQVVWWAMDPNRRFMLLDGFVGPNGRSLASCIDNRLMAIVGNSLVFPVARGLNLDPTIRATGDTKELDLLAKYRPTSAVLPYRISFPTRGVFAESVMGSCNSCEDIDDAKNWRWEQSPIDDVPAPTADTASRRADIDGLTPTQPPSPIISQQKPPDVPDPTGLAALIGLLGSVNFRDATGLAGSQANAAAALQQNVAAALEYGKEASKLAQQQALLRSKDQYFDALEKAKTNGAITEDQYKDLTAARLKAMSTAGVPDDADATKARLAVIKQAQADGLIDDPVAKSAAAGIVGSPGVPADEAAATKINQMAADTIRSVEVRQGDTSTRVDREQDTDAQTGPGGVRPGSILGLVDDLVLSAVPQAVLPPVVAFDQNVGTAKSRQAFAKMVADDGSAQQALLSDYINKFGFDKAETPVVRGPGVREPFIGLIPSDFAAVDAVATVMGTKPQHTLALWIYEGKVSHDQALHGGVINPATQITAADAVNIGQRRIRDWMRSVILFKAFGSDRLIEFARPVGGGDNELRGPDAPHSARFRSGLAQMKANGVPGGGAWSDADIDRIVAYFSEVGGAFRMDPNKDGAGNWNPTARLAPDSLASWLWLQNALFEVFRIEQEAWFGSAYGAPIDLRDQPWVTYVYWNGGPATRDWFRGAGSAQAAIDKLFGAPGTPPQKLSANQLDRYYARGAFANRGQSTAALANAVLVKYLNEALEPWFP